MNDFNDAARTDDDPENPEREAARRRLTEAMKRLNAAEDREAAARALLADPQIIKDFETLGLSFEEESAEGPEQDEEEDIDFDAVLRQAEDDEALFEKIEKASGEATMESLSLGRQGIEDMLNRAGHERMAEHWKAGDPAADEDADNAPDPLQRLRALIAKWRKETEELENLQSWPEGRLTEKNAKRMAEIRNRWGLDEEEASVGGTRDRLHDHDKRLQEEEERKKEKEGQEDNITERPGASPRSDHPLLARSQSSLYRLSRGIRIGPGLYLKDGVINIHTKQLSDKQCKIILKYAHRFDWDTLHVMQQSRSKHLKLFRGYQGHSGMHMQLQQYMLKKLGSEKPFDLDARWVKKHPVRMGSAYGGVPLEAMPRRYQKKMERKMARNAPSAPMHAPRPARPEAQPSSPSSTREPFERAANDRGNGTHAPSEQNAQNTDSEFARDAADMTAPPQGRQNEPETPSQDRQQRPAASQ